MCFRVLRSSNIYVLGFFPLNASHRRQRSSQRNQPSGSASQNDSIQVTQQSNRITQKHKSREYTPIDARYGINPASFHPRTHELPSNTFLGPTPNHTFINSETSLTDLGPRKSLSSHVQGSGFDRLNPPPSPNGPNVPHIPVLPPTAYHHRFPAYPEQAPCDPPFDSGARTALQSLGGRNVLQQATTESDPSNSSWGVPLQPRVTQISARPQPTEPGPLFGTATLPRSSVMPYPHEQEHISPPKPILRPSVEDITDTGPTQIGRPEVIGWPTRSPASMVFSAPASNFNDPVILGPEFPSGIALHSEEPNIEFPTRNLLTQIYLHFLFRLPSMYFSRVGRVFEDADLSLPELKRMAIETSAKEVAPDDDNVRESTDRLPAQYTMLKKTWESFIDSSTREWKTFNIISAVLVSAILTILQIQSAEQDPIIRYTALSSLICALISLLFGCMYIVCFGSMRRIYKAAEWALEAKRTRTSIFWNVWVLLAMPAIWLMWSIVLYIACIMSLVWRTSSQDVASPLVLSKTALFVIRIMISAILGLGFLYAIMILKTLRRYGDSMDRMWHRRINGWIVGLNQREHNISLPGFNPYIPRSQSLHPIVQSGGSLGYASHPTPVHHIPVPSTAPTPGGTRSPNCGLGAPECEQNMQYPVSDSRSPSPSEYPPPGAREHFSDASKRDSESSSTSTSHRPCAPTGQDRIGLQSAGNKPGGETSSSMPQPPTDLYSSSPDRPRRSRKKRRVSSVPFPVPALTPSIPETTCTRTLGSPTPRPLYTDRQI